MDMNGVSPTNNTTSNDIEKIASDVVSTSMFWMFALNLALEFIKRETSHPFRV